MKKEDKLFIKIALFNKLLTDEQTEEIKKLMANSEKNFPTLCLEKRFLAEIEVNKLIEAVNTMMEEEKKKKKRIQADLNFGKLICKRGLATINEVNECIKIQSDRRKKGENIRLGEILVERGYLTDAQVKNILAEQKKRVMICTSCKAKYNIAFFQEDKTYNCPMCKVPLKSSKEISVGSVMHTLISPALGKEVRKRIEGKKKERRITCPICDKKIKTTVKLGNRLTCPACKTVFTAGK